MGAFTGAEAIEAGAGTLTFTGGTIQNITNIRVRREKSLHETTANTHVERIFNKGLGTSSGSFDTFHDTGAAPAAPGTTGEIVFTAYTGRTYTIQIMIESYDVDWKVDGTCDVTYNWRQTGTGAAADFVAA